MTRLAAHRFNVAAFAIRVLSAMEFHKFHRQKERRHVIKERRMFEVSCRYAGNGACPERAAELRALDMHMKERDDIEMAFQMDKARIFWDIYSARGKE